MKAAKREDVTLAPPLRSLPVMCVQQALDWARGRGIDAFDAQLLLARLLERPRAWLFAHADAPVAAGKLTAFAAGVNRRALGEPLAYVFGEKEFYGLLLRVDARVLVPRPDTETLVDWALELLREDLSDVASPDVVDLGTGSGAIALALKHAQPSARITAVDASAEALSVAKENAGRLALNVAWAAGDWWQPLANQRFHLAVSNPPYVAETDPHLAALSHEPQAALRSGCDGLADLQRIVAQAPGHLRAAGWLVVEHGWQQADHVVDLFRASGFEDISTRPDLGGQPRCTGGRLVADRPSR